MNMPSLSPLLAASFFFFFFYRVCVVDFLRRRMVEGGVVGRGASRVPCYFYVVREGLVMLWLVLDTDGGGVRPSPLLGSSTHDAELTSF